MRAYLISEPNLDIREFERFISEENLLAGNSYFVEPLTSAETLVEICGRLCYMSYGKGRKTTKEFIQNIIAAKHFSVLEHANWTFIFTGISRSCSHELVRHRHFSFSQLSQRYVDESEVKMVYPSVIDEDELLNEVASYSMAYAKGAYVDLVRILEERMVDSNMSTTEKRKFVRQAARCILPNATETKIAVTGNARAWREFIQKRDSAQADPEIRELAQTVLARLLEAAPILFSDLEDEE